MASNTPHHHRAVQAHDFIPRLIELHRAGRLPLEKLIRTYEFDEIDRAFAEAASGEAIKPVLVF